MPILGIIASGKTASTISTTSFESIATADVGSGGTAYVEFTSIPSTYKHLQIRYIAQDNRSTYGIDQLRMRMGSSNTLDTSSTAYVHHFARGTGAITDSANYPTTGGDNDSIAFNTGLGTNVSPGSWGAGIIDITNYASTTKVKVAKYFGGVDLNGDGTGRGGVPGRIVFGTGMWLGTNKLNAVNILRFYPENGTLFSQYSKFALYGLKG
jgi:hypothetical protein